MDQALQDELIAAWRQKDEFFNKHYELQKRWRQSLVPGDKVRWYGDSEPIPREIVSLGERVTIKTDHTQELTHIDQIHPWTAEDKARYQDQQRWKKVFAEVKSASNKYPPRDRALLERLEAALGLADAGH